MDDKTHIFDPAHLDRCLLSPEQCADFKASARKRTVEDAETGARVVAYVRPDGHVMIDTIQIPV